MGIIVCQVIFDLLIFLIVLLILPISLLLLSPLYLWRLIVKLLAKYFARERLGEMLSELDTYLLLSDAPNLQLNPEVVISILVTLEGHVDVDQLKQNIFEDIINARKENGKLVYERLQQRLTTWLGYPFFEWTPNFDISNHVKIFSELKILEENKHEFVSTRLRRPFEKDCGMWEVVLVPYFNGENKTLVNLRVHHVICDCSSILKVIMTRVLKINPQEFTFPTKPASRRVSCSEKLSRFYKNTIGMLGGFIRARSRLSKANAFHKTEILQSRGRDKILISTTGKIPLFKFKRAKLLTKIPFTAIVNCAISGALRAYVQDSDMKNSLRSLANLSGVVFVPIPGHPDDTLINHCGMRTTTISLDHKTLDQRLERANRDFKETLTSSFSLAQKNYINIVGKLPISIMKLLVQNDSSFIYSNMPGPSHPGHLWSNFMSDVMFWNPIFGQHPLSFSILSYNEFVKIGVAANSNVIGSIAELRKLTERIYNELENIFQIETL